MPAYRLHKGEGKVSSFLCSVRRKLETNPELLRALGIELAISAAIGAGTFLVYLRTLCPTVHASEGAELVAACATLGIPGPTGSPLYILVGHLLLTLYPDANPAYVMNLFSAAVASAAAIILYSLARDMFATRLVAAATALGLAFSLSLWSQATIAGVYTLNAFFCVACLYYTFAWYKFREDRFIARFALMAGLGLAVHAVIVVNVVVMIVLILMTYRRPIRELPRIGSLLARGLIGLSLYAYLPIRSALNPALEMGDISSPAAFVRYLLRPGYWEHAYVEGSADLGRVLVHYVKTIPVELTWLGAALMVVGILAMEKRDRRPLLVCVLCFVANLGLLMFHGRPDDIYYWSHYLIPGYIGLIILAGYGLQSICAKLTRRPAVYALAALFPVLMFHAHYHQADKSLNFIAYDYGLGILQSLPPDATLITTGDTVLYPLLYLHYAEGMRQDIRLVVEENDGPVNLQGDHSSRPVYVTHHLPLRDTSVVLVPDGLAYRVISEDAPWEPTSPEGRYRLRYAGDERVYKDYTTQGLIARFYYMMGLGYTGIDQARAFRLFRKAGKVSGDNAAMHYDIGMAYMRLGFYDEAQFEFERAVAINPKDQNTAARIGQVELLRGRRETASPRNQHQLTEYLERARRLYEEGNTCRAIVELQEAVTLDPQSFEAHDALAAAYLELEMYHLAEREWETALKIRPNDQAVLANLANLGRMMEWRAAPGNSERPAPER